MELARCFAGFIVKKSFRDLPKEVVNQTKRCILDFVGVAMAGYSTRLCRVLTEYVYDMGGSEEASIFGKRLRVPSSNAALVNACMGHAVELDDGHRHGNVHPGVVVIPAAMAAAESVEADGRSLITSIALGYDLLIRVASAINPAHLERGFHTTGTCGVFGSATAAGKILELDEKGMASALGIAGIQGAGLLEVVRSGQTVKPLQAARAAQNGVFAASLAREGILGPVTIFEGKSGFCQAMTEKCDYDKMLERLGETYEIVNAYVKFHASCRHTHSAIDAALAIRERFSIRASTIKAIHVKTYSISLNLTGGEYKPSTSSAAKFSLPYCVAVAFARGKAGIEEFSEDVLKDARISELARKVVLEVDPELDSLYPNKRGSIVEVTTKNGACYRYRMDLPRGEPELAATDDQVEDKFRECTSRIWDHEIQEEIIKTIGKLEELDNVLDLTSLLVIR